MTVSNEVRLAVHHIRAEVGAFSVMWELSPNWGGTAGVDDPTLVPDRDGRFLFSQPAQRNNREVVMTGSRILTGDGPTGRLHLGHCVGSLVSRVRRSGYTGWPGLVEEILVGGTERLRAACWL
ncbi:MAG: hypothetical protein MUQ10_11750 [Anaerolineae bacterium]|nr:hypothetical protein [Anaerolineae bacterium]